MQQRQGSSRFPLSRTAAIRNSRKDFPWRFARLSRVPLAEMWALVTELLFSFILLAFLVISCQNVLHIASGSVRSVLKYIHAQLDRQLGEVEGVSDEEENVATRVVRRRVILKVQTDGDNGRKPCLLKAVASLQQ